MKQKQVRSTKEEFQVHNYDKKINGVHRLIAKDLSQENVSLIKKYDNELVSLSLAKATRLKNLQIILNLSRMIDKDWKLVTKEDIEVLVRKIVEIYASDSGQETNSSWDHKKILKIFFRWVKLGSREYREVGDPPETKAVRLKKVKDKIIREDLLTDEDIERLLKACGENSRDRALIASHYEAGTRPGEILSLRLKHVKFDEHGAILHVDGKTGPRTVRLVTSTPNLAGWLAVHPFKENPEAPLWIMLDKRQYGKPMTYAAAKQVVTRRTRIAGLSKSIHLNLFRHSAATNTAKFMTEAQMRNRHGWTPDSKMPGRYVHLINADVDDAIFDHLGIKKKDESKAKVPTICNICQMPNSNESTICSKCGKPLDLETAIKEEEKERKEKELLNAEIEELKKRIEIEKMDRIEFKNQIKLHVEEMIKKEIQKKDHQDL